MEIMNYLGIVLGLLGILATTFFALKYAEQKQPRHYSEIFSRIQASADTPSEIEVRFRGQPVPRVTSTFAWFWNAGKRAIRREDIPASNPLRLTLSSPDEPVQLLSCSVVKVSRDAIAPTLAQRGENTADLSFDFLDYRDGVVLELQHTGSVKTALSVSGVILGAHKGIRGTASRGFAGGLSDALDTTTRSMYRLMSGRRRRLSRAARLVSTILAVAFAGGFGAMVAYTSGKAVPKDQLARVLPQYCDAATSEKILAELATQTRAKAQRQLYVGIGVGFVYSLPLLWIIWSGPPYPRHLALEPPRLARGAPKAGE